MLKQLKTLSGKAKEKLIEKLKLKGLDENGKEIMDSMPNRVKLGLGQQKSEPLHMMVKRMIRQNADAFAMENGHETFEEANDFDIEDELILEAPYESNFDTQVPNSIMQQHIQSLAKKLEDNKNELAQMELKLKENKHEPNSKDNN